MQLNSLLGSIKADFLASLLQSHDPSEIILIFWFAAQKNIYYYYYHCYVEKSWEDFFCLLRWRGLPRPRQRSPKFSEPSADGASTLLRGHCSVITCPLLDSICPVCAPPSACAGYIEPIPEGASPEWRGASSRGLLGDLCRTPQTRCLSGLAHGVPLGLAGRNDRDDTLLTFPGSWKPCFCFRPKAEGRFALAQHPPTCVCGVHRDNLPSANHAHGHALFHPARALPSGQGCYTGLFYPDTQASVTPRIGWNPWFQPALKRTHTKKAQL